MRPSWLALTITILAASPTSYAPPPPSTSISAVRKTPPFNAHTSQETVVFPDADLKNKCLFKGQGRTYDLCPLMDRESVVDVEIDIPGQDGGLKPVHRRYRIMLGTDRIVTGSSRVSDRNFVLEGRDLLLFLQSQTDSLSLGSTSGLGLGLPHRYISGDT